MKAILASAAGIMLWAAAPQPAAAMPLSGLAVSKADAASSYTDVAYRRNWRYPRAYVAPYPYYAYGGYYPYAYPYPYRYYAPYYYAPGPYVRVVPFGFGFW